MQVDKQERSFVGRDRKTLNNDLVLKTKDTIALEHIMNQCNRIEKKTGKTILEKVSILRTNGKTDEIDKGLKPMSRRSFYITIYQIESTTQTSR